MIIDLPTKIFLNEKLHLNATGIEQDWEIELADRNKIDDFIRFYHSENWPDKVKRALAGLILASYDDYLLDGKGEEKWEPIKAIIDQDKELFTDIIEYWKVPGKSNPDDLFRLTPFVRQIK